MGSAKAEPAKTLAPSLTPALLHQRVQDQLDAQLRELPEESRAALAGTYVAFDPDPTQAYALVSCDDDGDAVVVISDALVEIAQRVAEGASDDEAQGTHKVESYARSLAAQTAIGARVMPPPAGFYEGAHDHAREGELFDQAVRGIVAHELARLARRHLVCPRPTAARESADDTWTPAERAYAFKLSDKLYDETHLRDADATSIAWLKAHDAKERAGYVRFLRAMSIIEAGPGRASVGYARMHPGSAQRASSVENDVSVKM